MTSSLVVRNGIYTMYGSWALEVGCIQQYKTLLNQMVTTAEMDHSTEDTVQVPETLSPLDEQQMAACTGFCLSNCKSCGDVLLCQNNCRVYDQHWHCLSCSSIIEFELLYDTILMHLSAVQASPWQRMAFPALNINCVYIIIIAT